MTGSGLSALHVLREVPLAVLCTLLVNQLISSPPLRFPTAQAGLLGWSSGNLVLVALEQNWDAARLSPSTLTLSLVFTMLATVSLHAVARPNQRVDGS